MAIVVVALLILFVIITVVKAIMVVPQAQSAVIERLGRFRTVASPGLTFLVPFLDKVRARIDLREQVVSFPPQPVITEDNLTVNIDTVVYFQVTDSRAAVYEISNYIIGVEQLTTTTLRNVVGGMSLEQTLTSRDAINSQLRGVLDEATGRWGIRVARVELKAIDPPPSIQDSMEKQMRADREKRAMILTAEGQRESSIKTAEGQKQSQILSAEGQKQAAILAAEAERQSRILRAQGERAARYLQAQGQAKAIEKVFAAIKAGRPTPEVLAYQYLQTLPQMAQGDANKVWMIPSDYGKALEGFARALGAPGDDGVFRYEPPKDDTPERPDLDDDEVAGWFDTSTDPKVAEAVAAAEAVARKEVPSPLNTAPPRRALGGATPAPEAAAPAAPAEEEPPAPPAPATPPPSTPPPGVQQQNPPSLPQPQPPTTPPGGPYQGPPQQFGGQQGQQGQQGPGSGPFPQQGPFGGPQGGPPQQRR
ncbi:SPFH domain-containing protein [Amycolatopsis sp. DSM 110486]|uniref:SPFH domain-containing protein n=1 Tax=Amycolatopsis sp. DSM 110486 TaxID=2865832 RepID=UPI001C6A34E4|nr:SPFH domain-containing protein [Amycolatopsis sp. DSM 110486]QYN26495.1 SPFH/Band 7/PHB domain protein [Amycolatopsis sp. DSM 110486]